MSIMIQQMTSDAQHSVHCHPKRVNKEPEGHEVERVGRINLLLGSNPWKKVLKQREEVVKMKRERSRCLS